MGGIEYPETCPGEFSIWSGINVVEHKNRDPHVLWIVKKKKISFILLYKIFIFLSNKFLKLKKHE